MPPGAAKPVELKLDLSKGRRLKGVVDFGRLFAALEKVGYAGPFTVEMIPFSRLPDLVMPDAALAERMVEQIRALKASVA